MLPAPGPRPGARNGRRPGSGEPEPDNPIAERLCARTYFYRGQPAWVEVGQPDRAGQSGRQVREIRLSQLWRYRGDSPAGERAGEATPCTHYEHLCWSCRLFGSANTEGADRNDIAVQESYRGHIRIGDLIADEKDFRPLTWKLAPLATPRPSAGQFYLDNTAPGRARAAARDTPAAATWGSLADKPAARPLRGRKFYWRTETETTATENAATAHQPAVGEPAPAVGEPGPTDSEPGGQQHPRWRSREHQSGKMSSDVALIPAAKTFRGRVAFDNLSRADLGSLLAALDPRQLQHAGDDPRAASWDKTVTSVGGGKPFGFGAVTIEVESVTAQTAAERYQGAPHAGIDSTRAIAEFLASVPAAVRGTWPALRNALTFGYIPDEQVWYPPGGAEKDSGPRGGETYDKSFDFFAITNGLTLKGQTRELVVLPDATASPAGQVLDSKGNVRRHERG
jgi:CRISPR-associated protein (TIGR03986 family)